MSHHQTHQFIVNGSAARVARWEGNWLGFGDLIIGEVFALKPAATATSPLARRTLASELPPATPPPPTRPSSNTKPLHHNTHDMRMRGKGCVVRGPRRVCGVGEPRPRLRRGWAEGEPRATPTPTRGSAEQTPTPSNPEWAPTPTPTPKPRMVSLPLIRYPSNGNHEQSTSARAPTL